MPLSRAAHGGAPHGGVDRRVMCRNAIRRATALLLLPHPLPLLPPSLLLTTPPWRREPHPSPSLLSSTNARMEAGERPHAAMEADERNVTLVQAIVRGTLARERFRRIRTY